jgi:hypothetical protein
VAATLGGPGPLRDRVSELRFYLEENAPTEVGRQLRSSGIDAVTVRELEQLGAADRDLLARATALSRVLCTLDLDFLRLAAEGVDHAGIAFTPQARASIGGWVRELRALHTRFDSDQVRIACSSSRPECLRQPGAAFRTA